MSLEGKKSKADGSILSENKNLWGQMIDKIDTVG
jgi:hypothetical protein